MNTKNIFRRYTAAPSSGTTAVEKPLLTDNPVVSSALVTTLSPVFGSGNIGRLAVNVVANRLLDAGADPRYIAATVTVDFDTPIDIMESVAMGMRDAAVQTEMEWTQVETSVKPIGPATGLAISAFGIGSRMVRVTTGSRCPAPGMDIVVTGPIGATGAAVEGQRRGVEVITPCCDGTALTDVMRAVYAHTPSLPAVFFPYHGIRKALEDLGIQAEIDRKALPVCEPVAAACDIMGLDPLELLTADAMLLIVEPEKTEKLLEAVHRYDGGTQAACIGKVKAV